MILVSDNRLEALARLGVFAGEWLVEASFAAESPQGRSRFEWGLDGQFLLQRTEVPVPEAPDSLAIVSVDPGTGAYTQHYYDSRGVVRLYVMTLADGEWTLTRESPDFSPLDFRQRFTGTFSQDGNTINGAWQKALGSGGWEHDFGLTYRRAGDMSNTGPAAQTVSDIIEASRYLVLATADATGRPWSSPVYFAHIGFTELYWVSSPR